jgi:Uma2 family endonuclease
LVAYNVDMGEDVMGKQDVRNNQLTYEDYRHFPDDGKRHEIIDGDHYVTPAPKTKHQRIALNLTIALGSFVKQHGMGLILAAPCDVILSDENVLQPDLLFISSGRVAIVTEANIQGAPDLIVEIISEATRKRDEVTKRKLYERFGVREYWIVDPVAKQITVLTLTGDAYAEHGVFSEGETATSKLLDGFCVPVSDVFQAAKQ